MVTKKGFLNCVLGGIGMNILKSIGQIIITMYTAATLTGCAYTQKTENPFRTDQFCMERLFYTAGSSKFRSSKPMTNLIKQFRRADLQFYELSIMDSAGPKTANIAATRNLEKGANILEQNKYDFYQVERSATCLCLGRALDTVKNNLSQMNCDQTEFEDLSSKVRDIKYRLKSSACVSLIP